MVNYLLEIGTEELPPSAVNIGRKYFEENLTKIFEKFFYIDSPENIEIFATPRRLAFLVKNLKEKEEDEEKIILGPPLKVAVDSEGKYTKPALAFAKKNNIDIDKLEVIENERGKYIGAKIKVEGKKIEDYIKEVIPNFISKIPFPKSMRWNESNYRFSRPIRWIVSLLDNRVISLEIASLKGDRYTYLHRFMTKPIGRGERKEIPDALSYSQILKLGFVIPKYEERKEAIKTQIEGFARTLDAEPIIDEDLLDEVVNLTEFPVGILGDFSPKYLILPKEVIITVCKVHQRYFNFQKNGELIPKFLAISNIAPKNRELVQRGYEKVLKARLEDALFFYEEDLKHNLIEFYPKLAGIQFHQKLGSMLDKVERNGNIALLLAKELGIDKKEDLIRANKLSKCDLLTEMVKEFDELQGLMGMYYALKQGEKEEVAKAIYEHYLPKTGDDDLPQTNIGTILALADKLDTVISFLSIGEKPKATADPFGIRRNSIGIVRLLVEKGIDLDLEDFLKEIGKEARKRKILKFAELSEDWNIIFDESVIPEVIDFINSRFISYMKEKGFDTDIINSVISISKGNLYKNYLKIKAIQELKNNPQFEEIMTVFKRVGRIIPDSFIINFSEKLLKEKEEKELYEKYLEIEKEVDRLVNQKNYKDALNKLLELKKYIDNFFDNVMVMVKEEEIKTNRLSLMKLIDNTFRKIADFTKITTK
ncbi:MAG: glycine--tRNA ligase subunit beta [Persephonella sp.]|nr:MAG: glycine--tRNA ligase subunit beta [Persephonella sp.]RUM61929.1 MAG: glycine--tRNA ligase subunit beta [Persephonella sp.]